MSLQCQAPAGSQASTSMPRFSLPHLLHIWLLPDFVQHFSATNTNKMLHSISPKSCQLLFHRGIEERGHTVNTMSPTGRCPALAFSKIKLHMSGKPHQHAHLSLIYWSLCSCWINNKSTLLGPVFHLLCSNSICTPEFWPFTLHFMRGWSCRSCLRSRLGKVEIALRTQWSSLTVSWRSFGFFLTEHRWHRNTHLHAGLDLSPVIHTQVMLFFSDTLRNLWSRYRSSAHEKEMVLEMNLNFEWDQNREECPVMSEAVVAVTLIQKPLNSLCCFVLILSSWNQMSFFSWVSSYYYIILIEFSFILHPLCPEQQCWGSHKSFQSENISIGNSVTVQSEWKKAAV